MFQYSRVEARTQRDIELKALCDGEKLRIRLILNTDGAKVRNSSSRSAYPVWNAIADLPPILRSSFRNILLCSIWYGNKDTCWNTISDHYYNEICTPLTVEYQSHCFEVEFVTIMLITELICTAEVLEMKQYNGNYGCPLCYMRGLHRFGSHSYPHHESVKMGSHTEHKQVALCCEQEGPQKKSTRSVDKALETRGVKGYSKLLDIVENLLLTCPTDTIQQTLKGVAKEVIDFFASLLFLL